MSNYKLYTGDCLEVLKTLPESSVDLIAVDPPYYKVKGEAWDRQWDTAAGFIAWIGQLCEQWRRVLKPNGSLYVFASPRMAARVEVEIGGRFNVLNRIRWVKEAGWHNKTRKEDLRAYLSPYEEIIFAEHYGADNMAKGEAGYAAKCDELRGFVFEPIRAYLESERQRAGISKEDINEWLGFRRLGGMAGRHYFSQSQWQLPTAEHYQKMRDGFSRLNHGGEYLRREYEDLRREYEDLRRPFSVSASVPYTDVWTFPTVAHYPGKHPTEKPLAMMQHIIKASSRPGAVVLDCCMGAGTTGVAAVLEDRYFIGCDISPEYTEIARRRIEHAAGQSRQLELIG
jgi:site-specific DNA-methyltransferase (adenine-specific)